MLFAVLPLGVAQPCRGGHRPEATAATPARRSIPNLKRKFITTTWVSAILFAVVVAVLICIALVDAAGRCRAADRY